MKTEVECEFCKKLVEVKEVKITKEGKVYLKLKCGHDSGFLFFGIIYTVQVK